MSEIVKSSGELSKNEGVYEIAAGKKQRHFALKVVGGIFFALLLILIFLSRTIYTYNQPTVTAIAPTNGTLEKSETVSAITDWVDTYDLYSAAGGTVSEVLVSEGDRVSAGQELIRMEFDTEDIEQKLKEIDISRKRNTMDVENINSRIEKTRRYISDLESEVYKADSVSDYDIKTAESDIKSNEFEITQTKSEIARLEKDYEDLKTLFNAGAASQSELDAAERNIQASRDKMTTLETKRETLKERLENTRKNISDTRSKNSDAVAKQETARTKQLADYQADLASYDQELKGKELDKLNLDLQEAAQRRALEKCENGRAIYAKEDATIISLPISAGQKANEGQLVASCGVTGRFEVLCKVSLENNFIAVGDSCYLQNTSMYVQGKVTKINSTEQVKEITVLLEANSDDGSEGSAAPAPSPRGMGRFRGFGRQVFGDVNDIKAGETFDVTFEKESTVSYTLIPNGTLNMDSQGYFLYRVARRDGILGKEFYVEKLRVNIGDSDSDNTAITSGIMFFEPIVSLSDKGFSEGDVVQLSNEGDFFAN